MQPLATPDITPIQKLVAAIGAVIVALMGLINSFDIYDISGEQSAAALGFWVALGGVIVLADAIIRNGRARAFTNAPKGAVADDSVGLTSLAGREKKPGA